MLWVPQKGRVLLQHNTGAVGVGTGFGTSVTTGGAETTKGSDVTLISSTNFDVYWVVITCSEYGLAATDSACCLDIWTGTDPEEVIIPDLLAGGNSPLSATGVGTRIWQFPLYIPAGTAIGCRAAGRRVSTAFRVQIFVYGGNGIPNFRVGRKVTTYGIGTVPFGTTITPGASGAEGAWAQITSSTSEDHFALVPSFQTGNDTTKSLLRFAVDLGVGAATEEEIAQSYWFITTGNEMESGPINPMPTFIDIPSGSRLVMRASNSGANDGGNYNGAIHAVS